MADATSRNADSPTLLDDELVLAKPCEEDQPFALFLAHLAAQELTPSAADEVWYAQTRRSSSPHHHGTQHLPCYPHIHLAIS